MMNNLPKYKVIHAKDSVNIFFPHSLDIISMEPGEFKKAKEEQLVECSENFLTTYKQRTGKLANQPTGKVMISKIMLNLSDKCTLDCTYCYASKYYNEQDMSEKTIDKVISKFFLSDIVAGVNRVVFFGGEPLMNLPGMEYFIKRMKELFAAKKIPEIPRFNIITNGTIYSDRIRRLFKKYNMGIIVSCDGPPDLQNKQRPFRSPDNKPSYTHIADNIKKMLADGLTIGVECTITKDTVASGYNHTGLKDFFQKKFGLDSITFVQENMTTSDKVFDYSDFYKQGNVFFQVLKRLDYDTDTFEVPYRLLTRKPLSYACGLGMSSFHILANGDVYPCQLIAGMEEFKISQIDSFNDSLLLSNAWTEKYERYSTKCNSCWAKPLCKFCPARQILESGSYVLSDNGCNRHKELLSDLIVKVVKMRKEPRQWDDFTALLKEKTNTIEDKLETLAVIN